MDPTKSRHFGRERDCVAEVRARQGVIPGLGFGFLGAGPGPKARRRKVGPVRHRLWLMGFVNLPFAE
jgi:hypothetical protein